MPRVFVRSSWALGSSAHKTGHNLHPTPVVGPLRNKSVATVVGSKAALARPRGTASTIQAVIVDTEKKPECAPEPTFCWRKAPPALSSCRRLRIQTDVSLPRAEALPRLRALSLQLCKYYRHMSV